MDEVRRLLASGRPSEALRGADRLKSLVMAGSGPHRGKGEKEGEEMALLWSSLGSSHPATAQTCGLVICQLVEQGRLALPSTTTRLLATLSHGHSYSGILPALGRLLVLQAQAPTGPFTSPYAISATQHPFICVLRSTPAAWALVLDQCLVILDLRGLGLAILRPLLLFLFTDPAHHDHLGALRSALLGRLVELGREEEEVHTFLASLLSWVRVDTRSSLPEAAVLVRTVVELTMERGLLHLASSQLLLLPALVLAEVRQGLSPAPTLNLLDRLRKEGVVADWGVVLLMLDRALAAAPLPHQAAILTLALALLQGGLAPYLPTAALAATCLQDLALPSALHPATTALKALVVRTFYKMENKEAEEVETPTTNIAFDLSVAEAIETSEVMREVSRSGAAGWLSSSPSLPRATPLLSALFLTRVDAGEAVQCLDILLSCVKSDPALSPLLLTLLTHRLGRAPAPRLRLALLHALPSMAADKGCIALVMKLVSSLASRPAMAPLRLSLLLRLWRVEQRCFPLLQAALTEPSVPEAHIVEWRLAQAVVVRDVVGTHSSQHGSDLLPLLSTLINQAVGEEGAAATSIALEGIAALCKEGVIDMRTTVQVLAPRCSADPRPRVLCSYTRLLATAPTFQVAGQEYADFLASTLTWLWQQAALSPLPGMQEAAYRAIACFPPALTTLRMLPAPAREGLKLPPRYCGTPEEAARLPEDVLPYVPGEVWARLVGQGEGATHLLASYLAMEVAALPRPLYAKGSGAEPTSYSHLPEGSLLRGLLVALQAAVAARRHLMPHPALAEAAAPALAPLLHLLAGDHGRALPPLDWSLLEPLHGDGAARPAVLAVLCRQAATSRSARLVVEGQLATELARDTAMVYMQHLHLLVSAVPAPLLALFVLNSLTQAQETGGELAAMLEAVEGVLAMKELPEEVRESLGQALEELVVSVPREQEEVFQLYLGPATLLPLPTLERLATPAAVGLARAVALRTALAAGPTTDSRFPWLNEVIEASSRAAAPPAGLLAGVRQVAALARGAPTQPTTSWLLELMGQVSVLLRRASPTTATALPLLLDVFAITVVVITETDTMLASPSLLCSRLASRLACLPLALARLLHLHPGLCGHLATWVLHLLPALQGERCRALRSCLPVFRYSEDWSEASVWGRVVMVQ